MSDNPQLGAQPVDGAMGAWPTFPKADTTDALEILLGRSVPDPVKVAVATERPLTIAMPQAVGKPRPGAPCEVVREIRGRMIRCVLPADHWPDQDHF